MKIIICCQAVIFMLFFQNVLAQNSERKREAISETKLSRLEERGEKRKLRANYRVDKMKTKFDKKTRINEARFPKNDSQESSGNNSSESIWTSKIAFVIGGGPGLVLGKIYDNPFADRNDGFVHISKRGFPEKLFGSLSMGGVHFKTSFRC